MAFIYLLWTIYHLLNKSMYLHLLTTFIDYEHLWTIHQHFLIYELSIKMIQHIFINLLTIYQHVFCASTIHSCRISRRKWHTLWTAPGDQLPGLSAIYLRRLAQACAELQPGGAQGARCRTGGSWTKMGRFSWENQGLDSETGTIQQQNDVILKKTEESTVQNISRKTTSFCWGCWRSFLANWMLFLAQHDLLVTSIPVNPPFLVDLESTMFVGFQATKYHQVDGCWCRWVSACRRKPRCWCWSWSGRRVATIAARNKTVGRGSFLSFTLRMIVIVVIYKSSICATCVMMIMCSCWFIYLFIYIYILVVHYLFVHLFVCLFFCSFPY